MNFFDLFRYAVRALSGHRLRSGLCLLGVAIGVTAVILLTSLGEGARRYVTGQFIDLGTHLLIVLPGKVETSGGMPGFGGVPNDLTLDDMQALRREIRGAKLIVPITVATETVRGAGRSRQVAIIGSNDELLPARRLAVRPGGSFLPPGDPRRGAPVAVLGTKVAKELFPGDNPLGRVIRIGEWRVRVIGILEKRGVQVGMDMDEVVVIPVALSMKMFNRRSLFRILISVDRHQQIERVKERVIEIISERHDEEDITCITQDSVISTLSDILGALTLALAAIAGISLSVAGIGIMNVMLVAVAERSREVGLLKALGVERHQIVAAFLTEAVLLASAGGVLGLAVGWAGVKVIVSLYPAFPASPPSWAVAAALVVAGGTGMLFGVLPALRAARLDPVAALSGR